MKRRHRVWNWLGIAILLGYWLLDAPQPVVAALPAKPTETAPPAAPLPQQKAQAFSDACYSETPYSRLLRVGIEDEAFVSFAAATATDRPRQLLFDLVNTENTLPAPLSRFDNDPTLTALNNVRELQGVAGDIDADGNGELMQVAVGADGQLRAVLHRQGQSASPHFYSLTAQDPLANLQVLAAAAGDVITDSVRNHEDELVIAGLKTRSSGFGYSIKLALADGAGSDLQIPEVALWQSDQYQFNSYDLRDTFRVAVGDLDIDGNDEIVLAFQHEVPDPNSFSGPPIQRIELLVFEYTPGFTAGSGATSTRNLRLVQSATYTIDGFFQTIASLRLATGNIDGDSEDELVLLRRRISGGAEVLELTTFDYVSEQLKAKANWLTSIVSFQEEPALALGDTDGDATDEIIVGYYDRDFLVDEVFNLVTFDAPGPYIDEHNRFRSSDPVYIPRRSDSQLADLQLAATDLDRDGREEIIAALADDVLGNNDQYLRVVLLADQPRAQTPTGIELISYLVDTFRKDPQFLSLSSSDWNNDSLRASYQPTEDGATACRRLSVADINAVVYAPPYWQNIQAGGTHGGSIGESDSVRRTDTTVLESSSSHAVSAYVGVKVEVPGFKGTVRTSLGAEYTIKEKLYQGTTKGVTTRSAWTNDNASFFVAHKSTYECFSYLLKERNQSAGTMRACEHKGLAEVSGALDTWERQYGPLGEDAGNWLPITRDWASLTLFRGSFTAQSSTDGTNVASRAVDSNTNGSVAQQSIARTLSENAPWWQIDLGQREDISKIRVWHPSCPDVTCTAQLTNLFDVFVSDTDFRTIPNSADPAVLRRTPGVYSFRSPFYATTNPFTVTSFLTLNPNNNTPIKGRFVRVQRTTPGLLALAEVQVFGGNVVEPHRYPLSVRDPDATLDATGALVAGKDGWFEVLMHNPYTGAAEWVRSRGNLSWNGAQVNALADKTVGPGGSTVNWSLQQVNGSYRTPARTVAFTGRVGAQFDVEIGEAVKFVGGAAYQYSFGSSVEERRTLAYEQGLELGGKVQGFPVLVNGQQVTWDPVCNYKLQPYFYEAVDETNFGSIQRYMAVDYVVPGYLTRDLARLESCLNGTYTVGNRPRITMVSSSLPNGTYPIGTVVPIQVFFSEPVTVTQGTPTLTLETGTSDAQAVYAGKLNATTLVFNYIVQPGHNSPDLDYTGSNALSLNGSSVRDNEGNEAVVTLPVPGTALSLGGLKNLVINGTPPTATSTPTRTATPTPTRTATPTPTRTATPTPIPVQPAAPAALRALAVAGQVRLDWQPVVASSGSRIRLERALASTSPFTVLATLPLTQTSFVDQSLPLTTSASYRLVVTTTNGLASLPSLPVTVTLQAPRLASTSTARFVLDATSFSLQRSVAGRAWLPTKVTGSLGGALAVLPVSSNLVSATEAANNPTLGFPLRITTPGTYTLYARLLAPSTASDGLYVAIEGVTPTLRLKPVQANALHWTSATSTNAAAQLAFARTGTYTLTVWVRQDNLKLDELQLVRETVRTTSAPVTLEQRGVVDLAAAQARQFIDRGIWSWQPTTTLTGSRGSALRTLPNLGTLVDSALLPVAPAASYAVSFTTPASYTVWARVFAPNSSDDSLHVALNGQPQATSDNLTASTFGHFDWTRRTMDGPNATLAVTQTGVQTISVLMREDGLAFDQLLLVATGTYSDAVAPVQEQNGRVVLEAERPQLRRQQAGWYWASATISGTVGGALSAQPNAGGRYDTDLATKPALEYPIRFAQTGVYTVWVRMWAADGRDDSLHVGLNGVVASSADRLNAERSNQLHWTSRTMDGPTATLRVPTPGVHRLTIWMREDGIVLDRVILSRDPRFVPSGTGPLQ